MCSCLILLISPGQRSSYSFWYRRQIRGSYFAIFVVMTILKEHISQITELCNEHHVRSLFAFGSVVSNQLTAESDIDLVVDIDSKDPLDYSDNYFQLKFKLESIFNRPVDLLEDKAVKNVFLKKQIDNTKVLVYGR